MIVIRGYRSCHNHSYETQRGHPLSQMEELIEFQIQNCTDAIGVAGTTGETACLDMQEHFADLALGSQGIISVLSNICPKEVSDLCYTFFAGDIKQSEEIQKKYEELNETLFSDINPIRFTADGDLYETEVKVEHQEHDSYCMICCKNAMGHPVSART